MPEAVDLLLQSRRHQIHVYVDKIVIYVGRGMIFQLLYLYLQGLHIVAGKYRLHLLEKLLNQFATGKVNQRFFWITKSMF